MFLKTKTDHRTRRERAAKFVQSTVARWITQAMPVSFGLELSNACNANCTFCGYQYQQRAKGVMSMATFRRSIDQFCAAGGGDVNLTPTVGDPLVDRDLLAKIRYARSRPQIKQIWFYTNIIALNSFDVGEFVQSGLSAVRISTCIKDKETYLRIYRSHKYQQMVDNIVLLCEENERAGRPLHVMLFLRIPKPFEEVLNSPDYKRVEPFFEKKDIIYLDDEYDSWGGLIDEKDLPPGNRMYENTLDQTREPCSELYRRVNILHDGTVNNCVCRDLNADLKIGNINENSLDEIWKGEALRTMREDWAKRGEVPKTCQGCQRYVPASDYFAGYWKTIVKTYLRRAFRNGK